jgi:hypothetical protein
MTTESFVLIVKLLLRLKEVFPFSRLMAITLAVFFLRSYHLPQFFSYYPLYLPLCTTAACSHLEISGG